MHDPVFNCGRNFMQDFISENDLETFEGWLRYQGVELTTANADERAFWRTAFDEARARAAATHMRARNTFREGRLSEIETSEGTPWRKGYLINCSSGAAMRSHEARRWARHVDTRCSE
jgi:hypothetical protein